MSNETNNHQNPENYYLPPLIDGEQTPAQKAMLRKHVIHALEQQGYDTSNPDVVEAHMRNQERRYGASTVEASAIEATPETAPTTTPEVDPGMDDEDEDLARIKRIRAMAGGLKLAIRRDDVTGHTSIKEAGPHSQQVAHSDL